MKHWEFRNHMQIILAVLKQSKNNRLVIVNQDYTDIQQRHIDRLFAKTEQIVGQIKLSSEKFDSRKEITRIVKACKEPFMSEGELSYVILGCVRSKNSEAELLHV